MKSLVNRRHKLSADTKSFFDFYQNYLTNECIPIFISSFFCPYQNFALENFIFNNNDGLYARNKSILIYRNKPSIVFGAFQNPWMECKIPNAIHNNINICRRKSGGGTVFHDLGNVNFTTLSSNKNLHRTNIMTEMAAFLEIYFQRNIKTNHRNDIFVDGKYKISGSAAKYEKNKAFHHHTLLCHSDLGVLDNVLHSCLPKVSSNINSNATKSVRSSVTNLYRSMKDFENSLNDLIFGFSQHLSNKHGCPVLMIDIDPYETENINYHSGEFRKYDWIYGNTPQFTFGIEDEQHTYSFNIKNGWIHDIKISHLDDIHNDLDDILIYHQNDHNERHFFTMEGLNLILNDNKYKSILDVLAKITF